MVLGVSVFTQDQDLSALLFLYGQVLGSDVGDLSGVPRARQQQRLPTVLTAAEVKAVLDGVKGLVARLLDGGGLRLMEALRLRVKDLDGEKRLLAVRSGKGDKDRNTLLPHSLLEPLQHQLRQVRQIHRAIWGEAGAECNCPMPWRGKTRMPPGNGAGNGCSRNTTTGVIPNPGNRAVTTKIPPWSRRRCTKPCWPPESPTRTAATASAIPTGSSQWLRHAGLRPGKATHLVERGQTIRTIQELLGHSDVRTTMNQTHAQPLPAGSSKPRQPFVAKRTVGYSVR
jgi:integrase